VNILIKIVLALLAGFAIRVLKRPVDQIFESERTSFLARVTIGTLAVFGVANLFSWDRLSQDARRERLTSDVMAAFFVGGAVVAGDMGQSWRELTGVRE
jgi:ABC-type xylose transport system permease subunit